MRRFAEAYLLCPLSWVGANTTSWKMASGLEYKKKFGQQIHSQDKDFEYERFNGYEVWVGGNTILLENGIRH